MTTEPRRRALLDAGKFKLAARARLAEGGKDARYEAAVLYHEAARAERRALLATEVPSPEARLASAIERCACLIEGFDAMAVLEVGWPDVLAAGAAVTPEVSASMCLRIDEKMSRFVARYRRVLATTPTFRSWMEGDQRAPFRAGEGELARFLRAFPGDARIWGSRSAEHAERGENAAAWSAISKARALMPDDTVIRGFALVLMPLHHPPAVAEYILDGVYASIERGEENADVCIGFVYATVRLASRSERREKLLRQALTAAVEGLRAPPLWHEDRQTFRAMELCLREVLADRRPTLDILYRCGLGRLAATAPEGADPLDILLSRASPLRWPEAA